MHNRVWLNGEIASLDVARIAPSSAGVVYGWGVFTTLGIVARQALAFDQHWERLALHAARARVALGLDGAPVAEGIKRLIEDADIESGRARITVLRSSSGIWRSEDGGASDVLVFVTHRTARKNSPFTLGVSPYRINTGSPLCGIKTTAYLEHIMAIEEARERGYDEALLLNERGELVEATAANLFWVRDGELITPSLATGCISGVVRRLVLEAAARLRLRVTEGSYPVSALGDADEVFLTSSGLGIAPVSEFQTHRYEVSAESVTARLSAGLRYYL